MIHQDSLLRYGIGDCGLGKTEPRVTKEHRQVDVALAILSSCTYNAVVHNLLYQAERSLICKINGRSSSILVIMASDTMSIGLSRILLHPLLSVA